MAGMFGGLFGQEESWSTAYPQPSGSAFGAQAQPGSPGAYAAQPGYGYATQPAYGAQPGYGYGGQPAYGGGQPSIAYAPRTASFTAAAPAPGYMPRTESFTRTYTTVAQPQQAYGQPQQAYAQPQQAYAQPQGQYGYATTTAPASGAYFPTTTSFTNTAYAAPAATTAYAPAASAAYAPAAYPRAGSFTTYTTGAATATYATTAGPPSYVPPAAYPRTASFTSYPQNGSFIGAPGTTVIRQTSFSAPAGYQVAAMSQAYPQNGQQGFANTNGSITYARGPPQQYGAPPGGQGDPAQRRDPMDAPNPYGPPAEGSYTRSKPPNRRKKGCCGF